jgi:hypothetical protein
LITLANEIESRSCQFVPMMLDSAVLPFGCRIAVGNLGRRLDYTARISQADT